MSNDEFLKEKKMMSTRINFQNWYLKSLNQKHLHEVQSSTNQILKDKIEKKKLYKMIQNKN